VTRRNDTNDLLSHGQDVIAQSRQLRDLSKQLLGQIDELRRLELESRTAAIGSPEFMRLSADITALSRDVFRLSSEQETAGQALAPQPATLEELDAEEGPGSPTV
jgi:hypothetical protein